MQVSERGTCTHHSSAATRHTLIADQHVMPSAALTADPADSGCDCAWALLASSPDVQPPAAVAGPAVLVALPEIWPPRFVWNRRRRPLPESGRRCARSPAHTALASWSAAHV